MTDGEQNGSTPPSPDAEPPSERTRFLLQLLDDQEHDRVRSVEEYVAEFHAIADFVRSEHANLTTSAPRSSRPAPLEFAPGRRIGRYELIRIVGEGGMGRAFLAKDPQLSREVVLKALRVDEGPTDPARERLRREARVLGRLNHPCLAEVLDVLEVEEGVFLVMPFYGGRTLSLCLAEARAASERATAQGPVWPRLAVATAMDRAAALRALLAFFAQAATALHAAHEAGVVHRDLKPQNVLVQDDGSPVVLDFGLALPSGDERLTVPGEVLGTPSYMAPEQIEGGAVDARTDVYSLAVMLYEALTLVQPFAGGGGREATFHRVLKADPIPLRKHQPLAPRDLEAVVHKGMERQPSRRYADAAAFALELHRVLDLEPTEARPTSGFTRWMRKVVHRRRMVAAVAALLAVGGSFAVYAWQVEAGSREVEATRQKKLSELEEQQLLPALRGLDQRLRDGQSVGDRPAQQAIEFVTKTANDPDVPARLWELWSNQILDRLVRDPRRTFATRLLEAKGERAVREGASAVDNLVQQFERLALDYPRGPEHAARRAWAAVAAARWVLWNGGYAAAANQILDDALQGLESATDWPEEERKALVDKGEFWITERSRATAGTRADARAELMLLAAEVHWKLGLGATGLDEAIVALDELRNVHRLANAHALRARVRQASDDLEGSMQDVEAARVLYGGGFTNHSFDNHDVHPDANGLFSTYLAEARILLALRSRRPRPGLAGEMLLCLELVRSIFGTHRIPDDLPALLRDAPLLEAQLSLAVGRGDSRRSEVVRRLERAVALHAAEGDADWAREGRELLTRLKP